MRKIWLGLGVLLFSTNVYGADISLTRVVTGTAISSSTENANQSTIEGAVNSLDGDNISTASNVSIATIATSGAADINGALSLGTGATVTTVLDEDTMVTNSATALATQQSIKAYADSLGVGTFKIASFTKDSSDASAPQAITGVGFTPRLVLFFMSVGNSASCSIGFDDGTNHKALRNSHNTLADSWSYSSAASIYHDPGSAAYYGGVISAFGTDGFTISWTKGGACTGTMELYYIAFK